MKSQQIDKPNYTQIPNVLLDSMSNFTDAEFRVVMMIARQTFGWHRDQSIAMSISFIQNGTGLSRQGVINACFRLKEKGVVERQELGASFTYSLVVNAVDYPQSTQLTTTSQRSLLPLVNAVDTNKETLKEKENKRLAPRAGLLSEEQSLRFKSFVDAWEGVYHEETGFRCKAISARSLGKELQVVLEVTDSKIKVTEFADVARRALKRGAALGEKGFSYCKSLSLVKLCRNYEEIRDEIEGEGKVKSIQHQHGNF